MIALDHILAHILEVDMTSSDATIGRHGHGAVRSERISLTSCFYCQSQRVLGSHLMGLQDHDGSCLSGRFACSYDLTLYRSSRLRQSCTQVRVSCRTHHLMGVRHRYQGEAHGIARSWAGERALSSRHSYVHEGDLALVSRSCTH